MRLLRDAVRKGDPALFKREVLRGATGLTEAGLRSVLGLDASADVVDIQNILATRMGRMSDNDRGEHEGAWWKATPPNGTLDYEYRILPQVGREFEGRLRSRGKADSIQFKYIFTELGVLGLYVLAFHGISLNEGLADTTTAPKYLLEPFVPVVKKALSRWKPTPVRNVPSGQLDIVSATVGSEPLYERAMREAGLNDDDIVKIGEFCKLYN